MQKLRALEKSVRSQVMAIQQLLAQYDDISFSSYELERASNRLLQLRLQSI